MDKGRVSAWRRGGLRACLCLVALACGDDDAVGSAGSGGSTRAGSTAASDDDVSPTRECVLRGTCGTCYGDDVCWEGFRDCESRVDAPTYSTETCPELGFPVNCSGQNRFEPSGTRCTSSGGAGSSSGSTRRAHGSPCSTTSDCQAGLQCWDYLGNASNDKLCLKPCDAHADCQGLSAPGFTLPFAACLSCDDGAIKPKPGEEQCVPLNVCGAALGASACDDCLDSCQGIPSCCTGCGCLCEAECNAC